MGLQLLTEPGPKIEFSRELHIEKYRISPTESFRDAKNRVAFGLKDSDEHYHQFREITLNMRFLEGGRIQAGIGTPKAVTPYNCYVSGTIEDSFTSGDGCIMDRAKEAAETMRMGGGIGYDFSTLRPRNELIRKLQSHSSGPVSFMDIFNAICLCTMSAGHRRGAQMAVLRVDHPDVEEFVLAKHDLSRLLGFNVSVAITDKFMDHLASGRPFPLTWGGKVYKEVDPVALWELIMRSTWDYAEPGVLFIDTINRMNNLWYCETISATNPCGEQPLPPYGACLLGSFNLVQYVKRDPVGGFWFDFEQFRQDIPPVVRAMDNVVDRAIYPLKQQEFEARSKRRMGLGITGTANAAEALGFPFGSRSFLEFEAEVLEELRNEAYMSSVELAKEKGPFPLFDRDKYCSGSFIKTLPGYVQDAIAKHGIRNSHLLSIAPTGTISLCADNISSGIEPVFEYEGLRKVNMPSGQVTVEVSDYAYREWGVRGKQAHEVTAKEHVDVLSVASSLVDSAVSKTVNMDGSMPWEDFKDIYRTAWERGCKGCTTYNKDGKKAGILLSKSKEEPDACYVDPQTGRKECA